MGYDENLFVWLAKLSVLVDKFLLEFEGSVDDARIRFTFALLKILENSKLL